MKRALLTVLCLLVCLGCISCGEKQSGKPSKITTTTQKGGDDGTGEKGDSLPTVTTGKLSELPKVEYPENASPSDGELSGDFDGILTLGESIKFEGKGASLSGSTVTVTSAGCYLVEGQSEDCIILVDTQESEKVELVLNGVSLKSGDSAPIYVKSAPKKVKITLAEGSVNLIEDGKSYAALYEEQPTAAIYSKDDLEITGKGALYITSNCARAVHCKDDLEISECLLYAVSADDGIRASDSLRIISGTVNISSAGDGLHTKIPEEDGKGNIYLSGGEIYIVSQKDGVQSGASLYLEGANIQLECGGGNKGGTQSGGNNRPGGMWGGTSSNDSSESNHALKAETELVISSGSVKANASHDGIHSSDIVKINGGSLHISAGDDGVHADNSLEMNSGALYIEDSYEGLEAKKIALHGGSSVINSRDDGMNAAGGSASGGGGRPGQAGNTGEYLLTFTGGRHVVYADGDGIDSNGNIEMSGGLVCVFGPTNSGNGAIDYGDGNCGMTISGGTLMAAGSLGMADCAEGLENQKVIFASTGTVNANVNVAIKDKEGNVLFAFENPKKIQCIVFSSEALKEGEEYYVYTGGSVDSQPENNIYTEGTYSGGNEAVSTKASSKPEGGNNMGPGGGGPSGGGFRPW